MAAEETQAGPLDYGTPATSAEAYAGFKPPEPHRLPSGAVFHLRRPNIVKMVQLGQIPNPLMEVVSAAFEERDQATVKALAAEQGKTEDDVRTEIAEKKLRDEAPKPGSQVAESLFDFRDVVVFAAIVAPTVSMDEPVEGSHLTESGELAYTAISDDDQAYIFQFATSDAQSVARFPQDVGRQARERGSRAVRSAPKRAARPAA